MKKTEGAIGISNQTFLFLAKQRKYRALNTRLQTLKIKSYIENTSVSLLLNLSSNKTTEEPGPVDQTVRKISKVVQTLSIGQDKRQLNQQKLGTTKVTHGTLNNEPIANRHEKEWNIPEEEDRSCAATDRDPVH